MSNERNWRLSFRDSKISRYTDGNGYITVIHDKKCCRKNFTEYREKIKTTPYRTTEKMIGRGAIEKYTPMFQ